MASPAAIGFRAHSGWACAVAITGPLASPAVVMRRRIEMGLAQPYHAAAELEFDEARQGIQAAERAAASLATGALRALIADLDALGHAVSGCGLMLASGRPLPELQAILASHALIHTAEGEHFRDALRQACRACGLQMIEVKERELAARASQCLRMPEEQIEHYVAAIGKTIGPPWRQDEKFAATAAWMALSRG